MSEKENSSVLTGEWVARVQLMMPFWAVNTEMKRLGSLKPVAKAGSSWD